MRGRIKFFLVYKAYFCSPLTLILSPSGGEEKSKTTNFNFGIAP
jgi:hypothetical protein